MAGGNDLDKLKHTSKSRSKRDLNSPERTGTTGVDIGHMLNPIDFNSPDHTASKPESPHSFVQ